MSAPEKVSDPAREVLSKPATQMSVSADYRDDDLARFERWLAAGLDATTGPAVRAPVEQFATRHDLRRLRAVTPFLARHPTARNAS